MEKCDKDYLKSYIASISIIYKNKAIAITSADTKEFLFVSQPLLKLFKQKNGDLQGKKLRDISQILPYINEYSELFKKVMQLSTPVSALIAHDFANNGIRSIKLLNKTPLISPITGHIVALIDEVTDFTIHHEFVQFIHFMNQTVGANSDENIKQPINLSKRQKEILFLLSLGKSPKNIADFISQVENKLLSSATVTAIINKHLYAKFCVNSTSQLIEKAFLLGFANNVPDSFIKKAGILMVLD